MYWAKRYLGIGLLALVLGLTGFSYSNWNQQEMRDSSEVAVGVRVYPSVNVRGGRYYHRPYRGYRYHRRGYYPYYRYRYYRPYQYYDPYYYYYDRGGYIQFRF